mgnify:FL=1
MLHRRICGEVAESLGKSGDDYCKDRDELKDAACCVVFMEHRKHLLVDGCKAYAVPEENDTGFLKKLFFSARGEQARRREQMQACL